MWRYGGAAGVEPPPSVMSTRTVSSFHCDWEDHRLIRYRWMDGWMEQVHDIMSPAKNWISELNFILCCLLFSLKRWGKVLWVKQSEVSAVTSALVNWIILNRLHVTCIWINYRHWPEQMSVCGPRSKSRIEPYNTVTAAQAQVTACRVSGLVCPEGSWFRSSENKHIPVQL